MSPLLYRIATSLVLQRLLAKNLRHWGPLLFSLYSPGKGLRSPGFSLLQKEKSLGWRNNTFSDKKGGGTSKLCRKSQRRYDLYRVYCESSFPPCTRFFFMSMTRFGLDKGFFLPCSSKNVSFSLDVWNYLFVLVSVQLNLYQSGSNPERCFSIMYDEHNLTNIQMIHVCNYSRQF